jgi:hypothetical protein
MKKDKSIFKMSENEFKEWFLQKTMPTLLEVSGPIVDKMMENSDREALEQTE